MFYRQYEYSKNDGCFPIILAIVCTGLIYRYEKFTTLPVQKFILAHNRLWAKYFWQYTHFNDHFWGTLAGAIVLAFLIYQIFCFVDRRIIKFKETRQNTKNRNSSFCFSNLTSTGIFLDNKHTRGLGNNQLLYLGLEDCCLNFVCFGGIGSGKTSRFILPIIIWLTRNYKNENLGGLVFDVKGDFGEQFKEVSKKETPIITIGVGMGAVGFNLLAGLSPDLASSYLSSALILGSGSNDKFWIDSATQLIKNVLGILQHCEGSYNLRDVYRFIFNEDFALQKQQEAIKKIMETKQQSDIDGLNICIEYLDKVYANYDDKVQQSIKATVSTVLEPFQNPQLAERFCTDNSDAVSIYEILTGKFLLVNLPLAVWGMGAKVIYTMIKLRFFSMVQERLVNPALNRDIPCLFICDEYQDVISVSRQGLSDLSFWDKSRSAKCIGIISSQSVSSFRAACHDRDLTDTVLQNFRQKICFKTEDLATIEYFQRLAGQTDRVRVVESYTGGTGYSNWSQQHYKENVVTGQLVRNMPQDFAIAFLNIEGQSYDDEVFTVPYYRILKSKHSR